MPHITFPLIDDETVNFLLNPGPVVSPIVGNTEQGGAAYDPSTGQATYAVYHNGAMRCFRTTEGYQQLVLEDDSVTEVGVILNETLDRPHNVGLTVIDGTLYALVAGIDYSNTKAGTWVYRDTSGTSGEGPWVLHGSVSQVSTTGTSGALMTGYNYGGEIMVLPSGRWICAPTTWTTPFGTTVKGESGVAYSDDDGETWLPAFYFGQGGAGFSEGTRDGVPLYYATQVYGGSRSFGIRGSNVYVAFGLNDGNEMHMYSPITGGATWTRYSLGVGGNSTRFHPFSVGSRIWRSLAEVLAWTTGAPESAPTYSDPIDTVAEGLSGVAETVAAACVIGPESSPLIAMTKLGEVMGIGTPWVNGLTVGPMQIV